jgi:hypothetical protein
MTLRLKFQGIAVLAVLLLLGAIGSAQEEMTDLEIAQTVDGESIVQGIEMIPLEGVVFLPGIDLTGVYMGKPDGVYYIRQMGNNVYWYGEQKSQSYPPFWSNIAIGTINGNQLTMNWIDVPKGETMNSGTAVLAVSQPEAMTVLTVQQQTGGMATTQMVRFDSPGTGYLPP